MTKHAVRTLLTVLLLGATLAGVAAAQPPAPTPLAPAAGASVQEPFTISWSAVTDPSGIIGYNWQVSSSSNFSPVVLQNSTNPQTTQDAVSGLANGSYFWRVQAVNGSFQQGAWSQPRSFTVSGVGPGAPGAPALGPTKGYSTFHPYEVMTFNWGAAAGAATYVLQAATDPSFPVATRIQFDNIPNTTYSFAIGNPEGSYFARVFAVSSSGVFSEPSNVITFSVFFNNPLPPPPSPVSPASGTTLTLPVTLTWTDVPNPQPSGYELQIARDSGFSSIEEDDPQLNDPTRTVLSLTSGQKFWRVRSAQGDSSPTTAAVTAWSATRSFTVSAAPPKPVSVSFTVNPLSSGTSTWVQLQLSGAPATATNVSLTSSNAAAAPVPATVTMPANIAWTQFMIQGGQVASATPVTITATLNGGSAAGSLTVQPTSLKSLSITPSTINGGAQAGALVMLTGQAPTGGATVTLSSSSPAVTPPGSVFVNPGEFSVSFPLPTSNVTANTTATVTATWNGVSRQAPVTLTPQPAPSSISLSPTSTVGTGGSSSGRVTIASALSTDTIFQLTSSHPNIAQVNGSVMVPAGVTAGGFNVFTTQVTTQTLVTISVTGGGVTKSATLTVNPDGTPPPPPSSTLSSFTVSPTAVTGGSSSTGTVQLSSPAPSGGTAVSLSSNQPGAASVPASVTVAAGATTASFTITTFPSAGTTVQLAATQGGSTLFAALGVNPGSGSGGTATLSSVAVSPASVAGGSSSTGTVTLGAAAPSGGAVVSLSSSNTAAATVPASVTVAGGATKASFSVTTKSVSTSTAVTITASAGGVTRTAAVTVNPPGQGATLTVTASGRSGERVTSNPAGISVAVGSTGSATFATGTSITLTVSNGRSAIWSGACSSGGNKTNSCTFTMASGASVTANVQ